MDSMLALVLVVVFAALVFEFINGFHDTANSIATVVATKVLSPGQAVILAATMNLIGAFMGTAVAKTISSGLVDTEVVNVTAQVMPPPSAHSSTMISTPRVNPAIGELIIGTITFHSRPLFWVQLPRSCDQISAFQSLCAAASAAPHRPPISACEDDDGRPSHQVIRFQVMPPPSAHSSTWAVTFTTSVSTSPEEIVFATAVPAKAPIRFMLAARITALPGDSTLVATTVAIELAVSWNPLMYSKTSAVMTTTMTSVSIAAIPYEFLSTIS